MSIKVGEVQTDYYDEVDGVWGRYCTPNAPYSHTEGLVISGLKSNREQLSIPPTEAGDPPWYIMPRIKINVDDAFNNTKVCRLIVKKFDGTSIWEKDIYGYSFLENGSYNGRLKYLWKLYGDDYLRVDGGSSAFNTANIDIKDPISYNSQVDFQIYWYGECEMWIDRIKVENKIAFDLFWDDYPVQNDRHADYMNWIQWEAQDIPDYVGVNKIYNFYADEFELNRVPIFAELNRLIKEKSNNQFSLIPTNNYGIIHALPGPNDDFTYEQVDRIYVKKVGLTEYSFDNYPFEGKLDDNGIPTTKYPETLPVVTEYNRNTGMLGDKVSAPEYDEWLQNYLDDDYWWKFIPALKRGLALSKLNNGMKISSMLQTALLDAWDGLQREPTSEEMSLMTNLAICYGAKSLNYFSYIGFGEIGTNPYQKGLLNYYGLPDPQNVELRTTNVYLQPKWEDMKKLITKVKSWGDDIMGFNTMNTNTYILRLPVDKASLRTNSYFWNVTSYKPGNGLPPCQEDMVPPNTQSIEPQGLIYDCPDETYLQAATFQKTNDVCRYFMVVNRRCAPENTNNPGFSDKRFIRTWFNSNHSELASSNSWSVYNIENGLEVGSFNKGPYSFVDLCVTDPLGWFNPGEGRLYKLVPTKISGGNLACDEYITGETINVQDTIFTNGHTLRIGFGTTLNFSDSGCIVVNGGSLICGDINQPTHARDIFFKGNNCNWSGIVLQDCDTVNINSVQFQNIKGDQNNNNYALKLINCNLVNINNCTFTNNEPQNAGAIEANYTNVSDAVPNIYISGNTFSMNNGDKPAVNMISNGQGNVPVIIDNNTFTSTSNAATAMYLSFITGTEISGNYISGFNKGIEMHYTSIDVIGNTFLSSTGNNSAKGIDAQDYSVANLSVNGSLQTGGLNVFDNSADNTNNIFVSNASFLLRKGRNQFNIVPNSDSYHLYGYFPGNYSDDPIDETENCFKLDNVPIVETNLPIRDVKWLGDETDIAFNFFSYYCGQNGSGDNLIVDYGNGVSDTIASSPYGSSGGVPSIQTVTPRKMYDSLCVAIRLKNYSQAKAKCYNLLNTYADSVQGLNAVSKLYLLAVSFDTSAVSANECKTFLNTLILNHPNNLPLVRKCNYYIQKCKVRLKEYQSALTGFQQIIQQNPYTYEALLASWDYAATNLLDSLNGHSGGFPNVQFSMDNVQLEEQTINELVIPDGTERDAFINDYIEKLDKSMFNDDDKDKFSKEERKTISSSIVTALDDSKKKAKNHIETLKTKSEKGDGYAKVELKVMKTINEVVKIRKPKTIFEHIYAVNKDIQKLNTVKNETVKKVTNFVPTTYSLSQNYPNPFNPITKINYELPKDGRVKLVIYDILGREMKTLVNNEFKQAGRYTVEFNGSQFASGVYFYRIQVEGGTSAVAEGKGFTEVKKMVLIK